MPGTLDNIHELLSIIEQQNHKYVFALIKSEPTKLNHDNLEVYTNIGTEPLNELLKVLTNIKKSRKIDKDKEEIKKDNESK